MALVDLRHAVITLTDGASTPNTLRVKIGEGNLTYSEHIPIEYLTDSGNLDEVRLGKPMPMDAKFDATWIAIGTPATTYTTANSGTVTTNTALFSKDLLMEMLRGTASGSVSTDSDPGRPYACNITVAWPTTTGTSTIVLPNFRFEDADFDMAAGTISVSGKCLTTQAAVTNS